MQTDLAKSGGGLSTQALTFRSCRATAQFRLAAKPAEGKADSLNLLVCLVYAELTVAAILSLVECFVNS